jgi:hypothetical protein
MLVVQITRRTSRSYSKKRHELCPGRIPEPDDRREPPQVGWRFLVFEWDGSDGREVSAEGFDAGSEFFVMTGSSGSSHHIQPGFGYAGHVHPRWGVGSKSRDPRQMTGPGFRVLEGDGIDRGRVADRAELVRVAAGH